jgi:hypothetical protein
MLLLAAEVQLVQIGLGALSAAGGTGQGKANKKSYHLWIIFVTRVLPDLARAS